jgi:uncharacterized membrane protein
MDQSKKLVLAMLTITIFVLVVAISSFYVQMQIETGNMFGCAVLIPLFVPLLASIGLFIGTMIYYLLSPRFEKIDKDVVLNIFDEGEREVIKNLLENKGELPQAEIVRTTGLPKVKVHRILKRLESKKIITKERNRKINIIKLNKSLKGIF